MKSTFEPDPVYIGPIEYPCLRCRVYSDQADSTGVNYIVLFTAHKVGTVVSAERQSPKELGYHSTLWDMDLFEPCHGRVVLEA